MAASLACHTAGVTMTSSQGATKHKNPSPLAFAMEPAMAAAQFAEFALLTPLLTRLPVGDGKPGPITMRLQAAYESVVRGTTDAHAEWRTAV